jgi:hypothetical protein
VAASRVRTIVIAMVVFFIVLSAAGVTAITIAKRMRTGGWELPTGDDLVRVKRAVSGKAEPSRIIYLHRGAITLKGGHDDAPRRRSSVVGHLVDAEVVLSGFKGTYATWQNIVRCVGNMFAPFDVVVTDALPLSDDYMMVVVGGDPDDLGDGDGHRHVGGLAPFAPGKVIPKAVVFAFSDRLQNRARPICETIAMEVGHAFGLDHSYECKDVMTYLTGCGAKTFLDKDVRCGENVARDCADGRPDQNSYQRLLEILGPRGKEPVSPR